MEPKPVLWKYIVTRKKLKLETWLPAKGIKSKKDLIDWCSKNFVEAPTDKDGVWAMLKKPKKVTKVIKVTKPLEVPKVPEVVLEEPDVPTWQDNTLVIEKPKRKSSKKKKEEIIPQD